MSQPAESPLQIQIVTFGVKSTPNEKQPLPVKSSPQQDPAPRQLYKPLTHEQEKQQERKIEQLNDQALHEVELDISCSNDSESDISKGSSKKEKKSESSCKQSNSERKEEVPNSRKCFNKLCSYKKIYKKIRSRVEENKYRFFCKNCYENYFNNLYCEFCEQIYSNNCENQDDDKWIGCDNCQRWNHIECQKKYRDKNIHELKDKNLLYECLACTQKNKNSQEKVKPKEKEPQEKPMKPKFQISKDQRTLIFHKKHETFPNLEYFLQNYSFRLWINQGLIRQDLQHLRAACSRQSPEEITKNKFKKIKNQ